MYDSAVCTFEYVRLKAAWAIIPASLAYLHFMGGGCKLVETVGQYNVDRTFFIKDICATAKGYEYYCYMGLRRQNQNR